MIALAEIQRRFAASIRDRNDDAANLVADDGVAANLRVAIHRNNSYASLIEVLAGVFPRIARLFDDGLFRAAAIAYIAERPPTHAQLSLYGDRFASFLECLDAAKRYPWLADLACLEWARHEAFSARDVAALTAADLAGIAPAHYGDLRLRLHPAVRLVDSRYAIDTLWNAEARPQEISRDHTHIVVLRPKRSVQHFATGAADMAFLRATDAGLTLDAAAATAFAIDPEHDLSTALAEHLNLGVFSLETLAPA